MPSESFNETRQLDLYIFWKKKEKKNANDCGIAMQLLGCSEWISVHCYAVTRVFWVAAYWTNCKSTQVSQSLYDVLVHHMSQVNILQILSSIRIICQIAKKYNNTYWNIKIHTNTYWSLKLHACSLQEWYLSWIAIYDLSAQIKAKK